MKDLDLYSWIALGLVLAGGINWGLVGLFNVNVISAIFGDFLSRLIFIIFGAGAGYLCYLIYLMKFKKA
jgi:uncharacterized membrane protein YuzA (DUF378 family)